MTRVPFRSRAVVRASLFPLRVAVAAYWYAGGRFQHTSRTEALGAARATAARSGRGTVSPRGTEEGVTTSL
ncbi:hypothetical protein [Streptomyces sp. NPDC086010]|uniref:hypothetical protein n=1 Tax=Streptomyces sp. NPDC086010 TaxID=3365745 RepID=UPI0037D1B318